MIGLSILFAPKKEFAVLLQICYDICSGFIYTLSRCRNGWGFSITAKIITGVVIICMVVWTAFNVLMCVGFLSSYSINRLLLIKHESLLHRRHTPPP